MPRGTRDAFRFLHENPVTTLVVVLSLVCAVGMPQIARQFTALPSWRALRESLGQGDAMLSAFLWLYVPLLALGYVFIFLVASSEPTPGLEASGHSSFERARTRVRHLLRPLAEGPLYRPAASRTRRQRVVTGVILAILGVFLSLLLSRLSRIVPSAGPPDKLYWSFLMILTGVWLALGRFRAAAVRDSGSDDGGEELGSGRRHWQECTRTAGILLGILLVTGVIGEVVWLLSDAPWNPLTWRVYTLWALVQIAVMALCLGLFVDAVGRNFEQRMAIFAGAVVLLALSASKVPIGYEVRPGDASLTRSRDQWGRVVADWKDVPEARRLELTGELTRSWFGTARARLARMPATEPVIFVAAAGGGSRAALYATLVLETLERTPPHGSLEDWTEVETGRSLADQVLFISSVSGGSVASAHYVLKDTQSRPTVSPRPFNTILAQLEDVFYSELCGLCERQWQRCDSEVRGGIDQGRECLVYERLCLRSTEAGFKYVDFSPRDAATGGSTCDSTHMDGSVPWPIGSQRFDDMATDFNAPLLRGIVLPGVERGEMVSHFWREAFGWRGALERGVGSLESEGAPGARPLLLFNVTGVEGGGRVVAGFPRLPRGLLGTVEGGTATALADIDPRLGVDVEEAVRMSANFPWGFDLPLLGLGDERRRVIDGGVLDNSGIDTLTMLLQRLEVLARDADTERGACPAADPEDLGCQAQGLLDELTRRGVILLEIDSGAKPAPPGPVAIAFANVLLPVHALSTSSYTRAVQASLFESARMEAILRRWGERLLASDWAEFSPATGPSSGRLDDDVDLIGKRLAHVVYVLDTEQLMTAWALSPDEKAQVLARFLAEDARQRLELRDQFEDIEGANVGRTRLLPSAANDPTLRAFLFNLSDSVEDLLRHERESMARATERRRRSYEHVATQTEPAESRRGRTGDGATDRGGWMYVGFYNEGGGPQAAGNSEIARDGAGAAGCETAFEPDRWLTTYVDLPLDTPPATLVGRKVKTTTPLHLRRARPDDAGSFDKRSGGRILPRDTTVSIEHLTAWGATGFYFAEVAVLSEPPS